MYIDATVSRLKLDRGRAGRISAVIVIVGLAAIAWKLNWWPITAAIVALLIFVLALVAFYRKPMRARATPKRFVETLNLFNEKVAELEGSKFLAEARKQIGAIVEYKRGAGWEGIFVGPEDESIKALVLTLRFFIQDNESTSLRNMRRSYRQALPEESTLASEFEDHCARLNAFLDEASHLSIAEGCQLTHREIFEIFVYGSLAHANRKKRSIFQGISQTEFFPIFQQYFVEVLVAFLRTLRSLASINQEVLLALKTQERAKKSHRRSRA